MENDNNKNIIDLPLSSLKPATDQQPTQRITTIHLNPQDIAHLAAISQAAKHDASPERTAQVLSAIYSELSDYTENPATIQNRIKDRCLQFALDLLEALNDNDQEHASEILSQYLD